jgi:L-alanine-DL-glutamate epimerase-like enolase superfamily enzyme
MPLTLATAAERWPIAGSFSISRGTKTEAVVVVAELSDGKARGRGECVPYARYGESVESVIAQINRMKPHLDAGLDRRALQTAMPPGAARNALDCAFWDLEAKCSNRPAHEAAGLTAPGALTTAFTISLAAPAVMAKAAETAANRSLLKVKLGAERDDERIAAVRAAAPGSTLIVDANEGWNETELEPMFAACAEFGVELIEQPLPAGGDAALGQVKRPVPVCADESIHVASDVAELVGRYDAINIKLDKTGGLTGALALADAAAACNMKLMVGCMVATSLAMAPAFLLAQRADHVDLDGPLLLQRDRVPGIRFEGSIMNPPPPELWG